MAKRPSFQFYPGDWLRSTDLRACSVGARGLWIEMICLMHEGRPYGHLRVGGKVILPPNLARMVGATLDEVEGWLQELVEAEVCSIAPDGCFYSRRMVRDESIREKRAKGGHLGGNPALKDGGKDAQKDTDKVEAKDNLPPNLRPTPASASAPAVRDAAADARDPRFHEVGKKILSLCGDSPNLLNYGRVEAWLRAGADPELDIYPAIRTALAKLGKPPNSLNYFDGAVADAVARRTKPMPEGRGRRRADRYDDIADGIDDFSRRLNGYDAGPGDQGNHPLLPAAERREEFG